MKCLRKIISICAGISFLALLLYVILNYESIEPGIFVICGFAFLGVLLTLLTILFICEKKEDLKIQKLSSDFGKVIDNSKLTSKELKEIFKAYANAIADI